jgi:hypothetical protein
VYDIGEADGHVFLSMEYIDGEDLAAVLRRMGRPTHDKAVEIARQIGLGLAAAHEAGMLHRDLKPANIMIDGRGRARITDFGLAGLTDDLARDGGIAGTPAYMAPEQLEGGRVSVKSDLYSFGLVLYELFTGKRAFDASTVAELRRMHQSATITTPSDLTRDIDPAVERVIQHCLETDPDARPASAYAVLAALPGGDPLAAALAAGETPSPELVANAGDRGSLTPLVATACVAAGLAGMLVTGWLAGPEFRALPKPASELSVRAADVMSKTGVYGEPPNHSTDGFAQNELYLRHLRVDDTEREAKHSPTYYWRRWGPERLRSPSIHAEIAGVNEPQGNAPGQATVLLDPAGRLIGLRAVPLDSMPAANGGHPAWGTLWTAAGLDPSTFAPAPLARPVPATCDSSAAWSGPLPWRAGEKVTVQMGASRGRLTYFTIVHDWGTSTAPVDTVRTEQQSASDWISFLFFGLVPLLGGVIFGIRNLRFGRVDWRGATRIAVFVYAMNIGEAVFSTRLSEVGLLGALSQWTVGRSLGHALMHSVMMWFAYVALEPYMRRLWPRMLVSWARLVSGRLRDPLVGRDLLIGVATGTLLNALTLGAQSVSAKYHLARIPSLLGSDQLASLTSLGYTSTNLSYAGSVCVLNTLELLLVLLVLQVIVRRKWLAVALTIVAAAVLAVAGSLATSGWAVTIAGIAVFAVTVLVITRFGLLTGTAMTWSGLVISQSVLALDLSSWYADRIVLPALALIGLMAYGAWTALAGKPILGDPLREPGGR